MHVKSYTVGEGESQPFRSSPADPMLQGERVGSGVEGSGMEGKLGKGIRSIPSKLS